MAEFEDWEVELLAERIVVRGGDEGDETTNLWDKPFRRLLAAITLNCGGEGVCSNCTLSGIGICIFEHADDEPPPAPCLAKTAV